MYDKSYIAMMMMEAEDVLEVLEDCKMDMCTMNHEWQCLICSRVSLRKRVWGLGPLSWAAGSTLTRH